MTIEKSPRKRFIDIRLEFDEIPESWEYNGETVVEDPYLELSRISRLDTNITDEKRINSMQESMSQGDYTFIGFPNDIIKAFGGEEVDVK